MCMIVHCVAPGCQATSLSYYGISTSRYFSDWCRYALQYGSGQLTLVGPTGLGAAKRLNQLVRICVYF